MGVVGVTILLISGLSILGYSQWISLVAAIMMFSIIGSYNAGFNNLQNAARHRALSALHGGLESWLKVLLAFVVILYIGSSSIAIVLGFSLASMLYGDNVEKFETKKIKLVLNSVNSFISLS